MNINLTAKLSKTTLKYIENGSLRSNEALLLWIVFIASDY